MIQEGVDFDGFIALDHLRGFGRRENLSAFILLLIGPKISLKEWVCT